jgi:hypothetical protein
MCAIHERRPDGVRRERRGRRAEERVNEEMTALRWCKRRDPPCYVRRRRSRRSRSRSRRRRSRRRRVWGRRRRRMRWWWWLID